MSSEYAYTQGLTRLPSGDVQFRVWAPFARSVTLLLFRGEQPTRVEMTRDDDGFHAVVLPASDGAEGMRYAYEPRRPRQRRRDMGDPLPDPVSRRQPDGVHAPSAVFWPEDFEWSDGDWRGVPLRDLVLYELHVGTFTPEGTFDAIIPRLKALRQLGVTAIELLPVAAFPGDRNWGYDGVDWLAVQESYGGPRGLQRLVDAAHREGLGVYLDVVYNHWGPEGNYWDRFGPYFASEFHTPWGATPNLDSRDSDVVRRYVLDSAVAWVRDYHIDGLRVDAANVIFDRRPVHIAAEMKAEIEAVAQEQRREVHLIAETHDGDRKWMDPRAVRGYAFDGVWCDDFHHALRSILGGDRDGYYSAYGEPEQLAKAFNDSYVYDGQHSPFWRRRHGTKVSDIDRERFIVYIQNHDQTGNRPMGDRIGTALSPAQQRLAAGLMLISPFTPMLFMGEEYGETRPFPFFASYGDPRLVERTRKGRIDEFRHAGFAWDSPPPDPFDPATYASAVLTWDWPEGSAAAGMRRLYEDLLRARREWPGLQERSHTRAEVHRTEDGFLLSIARGENAALIACANFSPVDATPPNGLVDGKSLVLSTEQQRYGGPRGETFSSSDRLAPFEMAVFG